MHRLLAIVFLLLAIQGCSNEHKLASPLATDPSDAKGIAQKRFLAVQHSIGMEVDEERITTLFEAGQRACEAAAADECIVLESHLTTGSLTTASLKFRAKPNGIRKLLATFGSNGTIKSQSTTAEDLSAPIADTAKQLAMLNDYRSKLEGLLGRASTDVDALIKVNRELAQVQSDLEAMTGTQGNLMRRVETEILVVSIASLNSQSSWRVITSAFTDFGSNLARGVSGAVTGIAYLAPWFVVLFVSVWIVRRLWRRQRRAQT